MATASEINSLDNIEYKPKIKMYVLGVVLAMVFAMAFLNYFPIEEKIKTVLKSTLKNTNCNPDFDAIHFEWLLPKVVITDVSLPASCLNRTGDPIKFNYLKVNFHFINFSPLGIPFKIDTEVAGQPISLYFVQGIGEQMIRLKDQNLVLSRLQKLLGENIKLGGNATVDLSLLMSGGLMKSLSFKAQSRDFQLPSMSIEGFTTPSMKLNEFYMEATSENPPRIKVDKIILGDPSSPIRANLKGKIDLQEGAAGFSPLDLTGELAFSKEFKDTLPLIDMMFQQYTQKDGFYQIRLGGTLGAPKLIAP